MKKILSLYHKSALIKTLVFLAIALFIVLFFSDFIIDTFVSNTVLWYKIQIYRWFIIPFLLAIVVYLIVLRPIKMYNKAIESFNYINKNYRFVIDNLVYDYFFYRHEVNKPFVYLSSSVTNVLGYSKVDFINNYEKIGAENLYKNVFEKHYSFIQNNLIPPVYEIVVRDANNNLCYLEVKEIPIFNEKKEIVAIEGTAKNITKYKLIELELNEKEKKYETIFEAISDGILVLKDNKFVDCNKNILKIFDCSLEELIMHTPFHYRFSPPTQPNGISSRELALNKIRLALKGQIQNFEWIHLRNGKDPFPAEITLSKFTYENEDYVLAIVRDISSKKDIIETLKEKEESFSVLYNNIPVGAVQLNLNKKILNFNSKAKELLKIENEAQINYFIEQINDFLEKNDNETIHDVRHIKTATNEERTFTIYINKFVVNDSPRLLILFDDITEILRLKKSYSKQEMYFKEILENSRQILYKLNIETGNYEYISSALYDILGYKPEEFYQMSAEEIKSLLHPDDIKKADTIVAKLIRNVENVNNEFIIEYRFRHKNGTYKWLSDKYQIVSTNDESYIVGNIMDITELKEAELRIKEYLSKNNNNE